MNKRELLGMAIAAVRHKTSPLLHSTYRERIKRAMIFEITDIDWDTDVNTDNAYLDEISEDIDSNLDELPKTVTLEFELESFCTKYNIFPNNITLNKSLASNNDYDDIVEDIINHLTDNYGWCINNCIITRIQ